MPISYLAHQVPLAPLKISRPQWFDATAMVVGSLMPDLLYAYTSADVDTNHIRIFGTHGFVLGALLTLLVRYLLAPVVAAHLPDLGGFRLRSLGVIDQRRPHVLITAGSLAIGLCSHAALDWLTHDDRRGPTALGYDDVVVSALGWRGTLAEALQISGSVGGALAALWILHRIGHRRLLDRWYGVADVERARSWRPPAWSHVALVVVALAGAVAGFALRDPADAFISLQRVAVGGLSGVTLWAVARWPARRTALDRVGSSPIDGSPLPPPTIAEAATRR